MTSGSNGNKSAGLSPTAQFKKVLMKGPVPLVGGKVLEDNDDEEEDYEDDDIDESCPHGHAQASTKMTKTSNIDLTKT